MGVIINTVGAKSGVTVLATSSSNVTYGAQLTELATTYATLTEEEKQRSFLFVNGRYVANIVSTASGIFSFSYSDATALSMYTAQVLAGKYFQDITTTTPSHTEITSLTNTSNIKLCLR